MRNLAETPPLQIDGEVLTPASGGYDEARAVWNAMIDRKPVLIARCRNSRDVANTLLYARQHDYPVSIKGGGHNVAGHAVCDEGIMIDLGHMRGVSVDPEKQVARVAGGATWADADAASQVHGLATPGGLVSDTGVAGLTLSGGIGWLRSRHGLCIDNLLSVEIVTADGEIRRASEVENADLFWAVRGGGGNFGVITEFEFRLHPLGPEVMFCAPIYALECGAGPIRFWRDFLADKSDRIGSLVEFSTVGESEDFPPEFWGKQVYTIAAVYAGDAEEGERVGNRFGGVGQPGQAGEEGEVLPGGEIVVEADVFRQVADRGPHPHRVGRDVVPGDLRRAVIGTEAGAAGQPQAQQQREPEQTQW